MTAHESLRIGMLTPSSNTVLEPLAAEMLRDLAEVSVHFSRVPVTEISLGDVALKQFKPDGMLEAAALLADAKVHTIGWNATSASWMGFEQDRELCRAIERRFSVPATTAVLSVNELLDLLGARRIAFVTPYREDVQARILELYRDTGYDCVAERHFDEQVNYAFAEIGDDPIEAAIRAVAEARPDAVVVMCTNLRAAHLVARLESEIGLPVVDSVAAFIWKAVRLIGADTTRLKGWGEIFRRDLASSETTGGTDR